jgi:hypothetical protein
VKKSWCPSEVWICPKATRFSLPSGSRAIEGWQASSAWHRSG